MDLLVLQRNLKNPFLKKIRFENIRPSERTCLEPIWNPYFKECGARLIVVLVIFCQLECFFCFCTL